MYSINGTKITLTRGDTFNCNIGITEDNNPYVPESGDVIRFAMKRSYADAEAVVEKIIPNDTLDLHLDPEDTADLSAIQYVYDIELTKANGDVDTFIRGTVNLTPDVI